MTLAEVKKKNTWTFSVLMVLCSMIKEILHVGFIKLFLGQTEISFLKVIVHFTQQPWTVAVFVSSPVFCNHMPALARGQSVILLTGDWRPSTVVSVRLCSMWGMVWINGY